MPVSTAKRNSGNFRQMFAGSAKFDHALVRMPFQESFGHAVGIYLRWDGADLRHFGVEFRGPQTTPLQLGSVHALKAGGCQDPVNRSEDEGENTRGHATRVARFVAV